MPYLRMYVLKSCSLNVNQFALQKRERVNTVWGILNYSNLVAPSDGKPTKMRKRIIVNHCCKLLMTAYDW